MRAANLGISHRKDTPPERRGERIAQWVESYLAAQGCTVSELAFRISQDKRDVQRLLQLKSCGHKLEDALASRFGWPFVEAVMAPVIDNSIEAEIARERAEIAAREERLSRLYRARESYRTGPRLVDAQDRSRPASDRL